MAPVGAPVVPLVARIQASAKQVELNCPLRQAVDQIKGHL